VAVVTVPQLTQVVSRKVGQSHVHPHKVSVRTSTAALSVGGGQFAVRAGVNARPHARLPVWNNAVGNLVKRR